MTDDRWIVIPRWDEFQHYKNREPIWIKTFVRQLHDDNYMDLSQSQRGLLHDLRIMFAQSNGQLSEARAKRRLCGSDAEARWWRSNLEAIEQAGLLELAASRPLPQRKREIHKELRGYVENLKSIKPGHCPVCEIPVPKGALADHMRNNHNVVVA